VEAVNYQWLRGVTEEQFLFTTWRDAPTVRKLKRPRSRISTAAATEGAAEGVNSEGPGDE
jgi:hypothetical protein